MRVRWMMLSSLLCVAAVSDCSCEDELLGQSGPELAVTSCEGLCAPDDPCRSLPFTLDMGTAPIGGASLRRLTLENTGTAILTVRSITFVSEDGAEEFSTDFELPNNLGVGEQQVALFRFRPEADGARTAKLVIESNAVTNKLVEIPLRGNDAHIEACVEDQCSPPHAPRVDACGDEGCLLVDFGNQPLDSSNQRTITLGNTGTTDLQILQVALAPGSSTAFQLSGPECLDNGVPHSLEPEATGTITVTYVPADGGVDAGVVQISSTDPDQPITEVNLVGQGVAPKLCIVPAPILFGSVAMGTTATVTVHLMSCGLEPLLISNVELDDDTSEDFAAPGLPWVDPGELAPGTEVTLDITYTPDVVDDLDLGRLLVYTNEPDVSSGSPSARVDIRAESIPPPRCILRAAPQPVDFGHVVENLAGVAGDMVSRDLEVTLSNVGDLACQITDLLGPETGTNFDLLSPPGLPFELGAGAAVNLGLRFNAPMTEVAQVYDDRFVVVSPTYELGQYPVLLHARGGGTPVCDLYVEPTAGIFGATLLFGRVNLGTAKTLPVRFTNFGALACTVDDIAFGPFTSGDFSASPAPDLVVPPGGMHQIDVTYSPTEGGCGLTSPICLGFTNFLTFKVLEHPADRQDFMVGLAAEYTIPEIDVIPSELEFGVITLGCGSPEHTVNVWNSGTGELTVTNIQIDPTSDPTFTITAAPIVSPTSPLVLMPGESTSVSLRFFPSFVGEHNGLLLIRSSDAETDMFSVPLHGTGTNDPHQIDVFVVPERPLVDVLWVVDDSGSMTEEQDSVAENFGFFIDFAEDLDVDFHIGVITTDRDSDYAGMLYSCDESERYITDETDDPIDAFGCNVRVTDSGRPASDAAESGLRAARLALDYPLKDEYNEGFLRDEAKLYIIFVSDEEDQSPGEVALYVDFFRNIKGYLNTELLRMAAIVGDLPDGCPLGSSTPTAEAGARYHAAVEAVDGLTESVCAASWSAMLENLAFDTFGARTQFFLTRLPEGPLEVRVGTSASSLSDAPESTSDGYVYRSEGNFIALSGSFIPGPGDRVEVEYDTLCLE